MGKVVISPTSAMSSAETEVDQPETSVKKKCRINVKLLPLKCLMLLVYGAMTALYPYLTLHMKAIGLSMTEISIISAIFPFVSCIGPPLGGALADKIGNYKITLIGFNLCSILFHLLMLFAVPSLLIEQHVTNLTVTFPCPAASHLDNSTVYFCVNNLTDSIFGPDDHCQPNGQAIQWPNNPQRKISFSNCKTTAIYTGYESGWELPTLDVKTRLGRLNCPDDHWMGNQTFTDVSLYPENRDWILSLPKERLTSRKSVSFNYDPACDIPHESTIECAIQTDIQATCLKAGTVGQRYVTLVLYSTFRFLAGVTAYTVVPILDAAAYKMSEDHNGDLGFQRMFSLIGMCIFPPLSGFLVGLASRKNHFADYSPAFFTFAALNMASVLITICTDLKLQNAQENIWRSVGKILKNPKVAMFVLVMFLAGCVWGFLENFLFVFMAEDLRSPKWLMGLSNTVSSVAAIPVVGASTYIMRVFGHTKILVLCFLIYGIRFLAYSVIYNPFDILPVEALEAFTTSLLWVVASVHCGKIAPDYLATLQGVIGCVHHAFGRGVGSLIGGIMFDKLKPRLTYLIFAVASGVFGVVYFVLHYVWLRKIANPQKDEPDIIVKEGDDPRPSVQHHLSPVDEEYLAQFSRMEAFSRRYSLAPVLTETVRADEEEGAYLQYSPSNIRRRRSTLVPTLLSGR